MRRRARLLASISALSAPAFILATPGAALAQETEVGEVVVTATRREAAVQDVPINIAAVGGEEIEDQGISNLKELARWVPGVNIVNSGSRGDSLIVVRGLNANPLAAQEQINNDGGGTVATYLGEIPFYIDLKPQDLERVEVLLGPQGTLYGAGTLGGAIRYIPRRPQFGRFEMELRSDLYQYSEADDLSTDLGVTFNLPIGETFALRGSLGRLDDSGFIDYNYLVRQPGVSDPDAVTGAAREANLTRRADANFEETVSGRLAARWRPAEWLDGTLTYYFQSMDSGGRQVTHRRLALQTGDYENAMRVLEPNERDNQLLALEVTADLGFAELTSATGWSTYEEHGQRDQTDLLITLEYGYELFPSFTAFTREDQDDERFNQEVRLVSTHGGPISWIVGGFYNKLESFASSKEFTPGYAEYLGGVRPDALEYFAVDLQELTETAFYGEATWQITPQWQVTVGGRRYEYELETQSAVDFPLFNSVFGGAGPDEVNLVFEPGGQEDEGWLYKFNTSYEPTEDLLFYGTVSQGYRIGGSNGVAPCPDPLPPNQIACALPNEIAFTPDKTKNYELGVKSQWFDNRLTLNAAVYLIEWEDPQVLSATENGLIPITRNGEAAETRGLEINFAADLTENLSVRGAYALNEAELTERTINLVPRYNPPGFQSTISYENGEPGDRLPGSPEHQGSLFLDYQRELGNGLTLDASYGFTFQTDVLTRLGGRGGGITLDGYQVHSASISIGREDDWRATLYVDNLFDEFAETGVRETPLADQPVFDDTGQRVFVRRFYTEVLTPRVIGIRLSKRFGFDVD